jgi:isopenicillin-N epimerase
VINRRDFLHSIVGAAAVARPALRDDGLARILSATSAIGDRSPESVAEDEDFWFAVQQAFTVNRTLIHLNNGGVCPSPKVVQDAMKRYLDYSNQATSYHMWAHLEPEVEGVRIRLARAFGCDTEEMAITRNASESLEICQFGIDLAPGDEVLTTGQDYPRMLTTWEQRVRRDGVVVKKVTFPAPPPSMQYLIDQIESGITSRTKVILFCHITNLSGQIFPVREICRMARERGIETIVDGAHAFAHFPFKRDDLECDYYGTSLHKWLLAPHGTGFLYVKRDKIEKLWPLMAAPESMNANIRKFEEIGTHPAANHNAIGEALTFHNGIGAERKAARLRYLSAHLWNTQKIIVTPIGHEACPGIRVTPNVYTTLDEIDRFAEAMEDVIQHGIPA